MNTKHTALPPTVAKPPPVRIPMKWVWHYGILQSLRDRLSRDRDVQLAEATNPVVLDTNDLADCATDEFDHDLALGILSQEQSALQEVDAAIQRILEGTYGVCEETGKPIPAARLRAVPWTRLRKEAQELREKQGLVSRTHLEPAGSVHGPLKRSPDQPSSYIGRRKSKQERKEDNAPRDTGID